MFQYACPTMTLSLERQPVCQPQPVYPTVLCAILSVKRRSCEEQAVKLREALNEKIDGVFHSRLPSRLFCSVAFISTWHPKKLLAFEHGRDRYKLRRATLDWLSRDIYLRVHLANTWLRQITGGNNFPQSQAAYGQRCNPKG